MSGPKLACDRTGRGSGRPQQTDPGADSSRLDLARAVAAGRRAGCADPARSDHLPRASPTRAWPARDRLSFVGLQNYVTLLPGRRLPSLHLGDRSVHHHHRGHSSSCWAWGSPWSSTRTSRVAASCARRCWCPGRSSPSSRRRCGSGCTTTSTASFNDLLVDKLHLLPSNIAWVSDPNTSIPAIAAVDIWKTTPFVALLLLAGLQVIPGDIYEAARVDGANAIQQFFRLTLPLLRPAIVVDADLSHARFAAGLRRLLRHVRQPPGHDDHGDLRPAEHRDVFAAGLWIDA